MKKKPPPRKPTLEERAREATTTRVLIENGFVIHQHWRDAMVRAWHLGYHEGVRDERKARRAANRR